MSITILNFILILVTLVLQLDNVVKGYHHHTKKYYNSGCNNLVKYSVRRNIHQKYDISMKSNLYEPEINKNKRVGTMSNKYDYLILVSLSLIFPIVILEVFKQILSSLIMLSFIGIMGSMKLVYDNYNNRNSKLPVSKIRAILDQESDIILNQSKELPLHSSKSEYEVIVRDKKEKIIDVMNHKRHYELLDSLKHVLTKESKDNIIIIDKLQNLKDNIRCYQDRIETVL